MRVSYCNCPGCLEEQAHDRIDEWDVINNPLIIEADQIDPIDRLTFPSPPDAAADLARIAEEAWRLSQTDWNKR